MGQGFGFVSQQAGTERKRGRTPTLCLLIATSIVVSSWASLLRCGKSPCISKALQQMAAIDYSLPPAAGEDLITAANKVLRQKDPFKKAEYTDAAARLWREGRLQAVDPNLPLRPPPDRPARDDEKVCCCGDICVSYAAMQGVQPGRCDSDARRRLV